MEYLVRHRTTYRYAQDVSYSCHLAHLRLRDTGNQSVMSSEVSLEPAPASRAKRADYFGNVCEWFTLDQPHTFLEVLAESRVTVDPPAQHDAALSESWESIRALLEDPRDAESQDAVQFIFDSPLTAFSSDVAGYAIKSFPPGQPLLYGALDLMNRIHADFRYDTTVTDATTPVDRVFEIRAGVCQDLAHVGIAAMRSLGLPARYVSGYLLTQPPPGMPRMLGADASHAWFSVWTPKLGWIDLDPTNDVEVGEGHVTVAYGRDYGDVAPLNGIILGGHDHVIEVGVDVISGRCMNAALIMGIALATCAATMLGGIFALSLKRCIAIVLGFSAGAVLGVALFDLLPEASALGRPALGLVTLIAVSAAGFFLYGLFDRLVTRHDSPGCGPDPARGMLGAGSFSIHSLLDGLGIGLAFQASHEAGLVVAAAVLAHDFADGLNTVNVVVKHGGSRSSALRWLTTDAVAPIVGAGLSLLIAVPKNELALLLAGFAGFFFYIGGVDLLPESQRAGKPLWSGIATLLGLGFLFAVTRIAS